jgi:hypothetical protein
VSLSGATSGGVRADAVRVESIAGVEAPQTPPARPEGVTITAAQAQQLVASAVARWSQADLAPALAALLQTLPVSVLDLPDNLVAAITSKALLLDANAAGWGWFLDASPWEDAEFVRGARPRGLDVLTALLHEQGHKVGRADLPSGEDGRALPTLPARERHVPAGVLFTGQNPVQRTDVDGSGETTPLDALLVVNQINGGGSPLSPVVPGQSPTYYDASGDGQLTALDVLQIINHLNTPLAAGAGEAESVEPGAAVSRAADLAPMPAEFPARNTSPAPGAALSAVVARPAMVPWTAVERTATWPQETAAVPAGSALEDDWDDLLNVLAEDVADQWDPA